MLNNFSNDATNASAHSEYFLVTAFDFRLLRVMLEAHTGHVDRPIQQPWHRVCPHPAVSGSI